MFVLKGDGSVVPLKPSEFESERHFQQQLEQHPELLSGSLIDEDSPRKWVIVRREMGIPNAADSGNRWSADHLFLDQDAVPTIVEVKRQSDTRLRREVVAQMLEYAANGTAYWTDTTIRASFNQTCEEQEREPDSELREQFGKDLDIEDYWRRVKTNLEAQRVRLLFVADLIPPELRRLVEFLNRQMDPVEVLALELKQYVGEQGLRTIVPTLFGQTQNTRDLKAGKAQRSRSLLAPDHEYWADRTPATIGAVDKLLSFAIQCGPHVQVNYHLYYIGMLVAGDVCNFVTITPKQEYIRFSLRLKRSAQVDGQIASAGLFLIEYKNDASWQGYRLRLNVTDVQQHEGVLRTWLERAYLENHTKGAA